MKNKLIKILILIALIVMFWTSVVLATDLGIDPNDYKPMPNAGNSTIFKEKVGGILGFINLIGVICSVVVLIVIGLRYMLGSVEEKAEYKKTMLGYLIGAVLIFTASTIPNMLYKIGSSIGREQHVPPPQVHITTEQELLY